jgi:hypothetical protein
MLCGDVAVTPFTNCHPESNAGSPVTSAQVGLIDCKAPKKELAGCLVFPSFPSNAARLLEKHGKRQTCVAPAVALPAAHGVLQQQEALHILETET